MVLHLHHSNQALCNSEGYPTMHCMFTTYVGSADSSKLFRRSGMKLLMNLLSNNLLESY